MPVYKMVLTGTQQNGGYGVCLYIGKANFTFLPNFVQVGMPSALNSLSFRYLCMSSCLTGTHMCPVSSTRGAQKFGGINKNKI